MKPSIPLLLFAAGRAAQARKPNILFVLTDDQDHYMDSTAHMPFLQSDIVRKGTTFNRHFCTVAICCPSRANMWTGRAAHNTNITDVAPPFGGYTRIVEQGINDDYLPVWMQQAGYNTYYVGKLWNFHNIKNYDDPHANGFNASDFLLDPHTYRYYDAVITHNGEPPVSYAGNYSTDVVAELGYQLLDEALSHTDPWFLALAPIAPHSNTAFDASSNSTYFDAPVSAPRHEHLFADYKIPRTESFNARVDGGVSWVGRLPELNESILAYNDHYQRQRLRSLQAVDEMLHEVVKKLDHAGELENTYIFYTTDNGFHISQHRMHPGKECGYDTDIHIPLYIRGPGVAPGAEIDVVTTHTDIAPTVLKLAGVDKQLDGEPIPLTAEDALGFKTEHAAIEYWGHGIPEGQYGYRSKPGGIRENVYLNNTYKGIRLIGEDHSVYYSVWCTGEREIYDLKRDPHQTVNLFSNPAAAAELSIAGRSITEVVSRLDALMMVLKDCKDEVCTRPWEVLHPKAGIFTLKQALASQYDSLYASQPRMYYESCELGFIPEKESRDHVHSYSRAPGGGGGSLRKQQPFDYGNDWVFYL
ncbi:alkaline-phosphatase-like protein [Xylariaceae sp. FL0255]|nr:alkaline-phosphatase-like protein [Xylariaceae sp. FL0255]